MRIESRRKRGHDRGEQDAEFAGRGRVGDHRGCGHRWRRPRIEGEPTSSAFRLRDRGPSRISFVRGALAYWVLGIIVAGGGQHAARPGW